MSNNSKSSYNLSNTLQSDDMLLPPPPHPHHHPPPPQMEIEASDQGVPAQAITMTLYIEVERSTRAPRFDNTPYQTQRIAETRRVGQPVFQVTAHDPDIKVGSLRNST